ncbi:MAG: hypothetical protein COU30_03190 [Candidatus Magasanikbacteria bacterium CG10_big_fil_rev_8_21_14_0_10_38_6]|uniref:SbsA Ig-like domain-containing protein n=1 Tax=Candidatus Magasanikbacteria bacterium CG10_big_fil_rev_8_21_14_0_10_38_6 TaxID=1974647 RepID=A0A2M6P0R2_9BACT|nr:MAG: hypothetical protein COU30_03190 [Candidatus Magasanikbacteria bacterium CG10_big_fil_rev_8_21_14_0_10_38_6]
MVDNEANCLRDGAGNIVEYYGDCLPAVDGEEFNWEASCDHLKIDAVRIFPTADENIRVQAAAMTMYEGEDLSVFTFVFRPFQFLEDTVPYTVYLSNQIMKQQVNESIFAQQRFSYYTWEFSTGSDFDFDPPVVQSTYPAFTGEEQVIPRNTILQVTFNEAMDPLAVAGQFSPPNGTFSHIVLNTSTINTNPAADYHPQFSGEWVISNGYRTIEFVPNDECGRNACGEPIYCLPVNDKNGEDRMHALLRTARTNGVDAQDFSAIPFSGIADVSGNALDGNKDGVRDNKPPINDPFRITIPAQGNPDGAIDERLADNFYWTFRVADEIDNTVPYVQQVFPGLDQEDVVETENVLITFSKPMISRSLSHIAIEEHPGDIVDDSLWFRTRSSLNGNGDTVAEIDHRALGPSGLDLYYFTSIPTSVRSLNQNCLYPGRGPIGTPEDERNVSPVCEYDSESGVDRNCVPVTFEQTKDTACVQTTNQDVLPILQPDIATCLEGMKQEIVSPRFDNILDEGE